MLSFLVEKQCILISGLLVYADPRQQANLFFHELPFNQVSGGNAVSSWDNLEGFRFTKTRFPLVQPTKMLRFDETHFPTSQIPNTVVAHAVHHQDLDGLMSAKGTNIKVFNKGIVSNHVIHSELKQKVIWHLKESTS
jgi:hypothetical protein